MRSHEVILPKRSAIRSPFLPRPVCRDPVLAGATVSGHSQPACLPACRIYRHKHTKIKFFLRGAES
jgi:hypothetical protein